MFSKDDKNKVEVCEDRESVSKLTNYDEYIMSKKEKLIYIGGAGVLAFFIAFVFYRSIIISLVVCPLAIFYPNLRTKQIIRQRKDELNIQFKDMLYSLSSSLSAGKSVESAFENVLSDLSLIYPNPETFIILETQLIVRKIKMNETIEVALEDFAKRSHLEDIENFVDVFRTCKRTGGNIVEIIKNTSNIINDKIEIRHEIDTILAQRRFEQKVLNMMPIAMIILLSVSANDYVAPVFNTILGRVVMTMAIILIGVAYYISHKIMDIRV